MKESSAVAEVDRDVSSGGAGEPEGGDELSAGSIISAASGDKAVVGNSICTDSKSSSECFQDMCEIIVDKFENLLMQPLIPHKTQKFGTLE